MPPWLDILAALAYLVGAVWGVIGLIYVDQKALREATGAILLGIILTLL